MFPFAITSLGGVPGITGNLFATVAAAGVFTLSGKGLKVNDFMIVVGGASGSLSSGGAFTTPAGGGSVYVRQLTSGDIAGTYTAGSSPVGLGFYTGPVSLTYISTDSIAGPAVNKSSPGFVRNIKHLAPYAVIQADGTSAGNTSISSPVGFVRRTAGFNGTNLTEPHDMLVKGYVNSTPIVWSANGSTNAIFIYEFRS